MDVNDRYKTRIKAFEEGRVISEVMESTKRNLQALTIGIRPAKVVFDLGKRGRTCNNSDHELFGFPIEECLEDECILEFMNNE